MRLEEICAPAKEEQQRVDSQVKNHLDSDNKLIDASLRLCLFHFVAWIPPLVSGDNYFIFQMRFSSTMRMFSRTSDAAFRVVSKA